MRVLTFLVIVGLIIFAITHEPTQTASQPPLAATKPPPTQEESAEEKRFQANVVAVRRIKAAMKNPASFKLEDAIETPDGALCIVYRATNSFNAVVPGQAVVYKGQITTSDAGDEFRSRWNSRCFKKRGEDMKHIRQAL